VISRIVQIVDPDSARSDVRDILDDRRFRSEPAPRPFRGVLQWLGDRLEPIARAIGDAIDFVPWFVWLAIGITLVGLVIAWIVRRVLPRRNRTRATAAASHATTSERADELERAADAAEREGDFERAVRLRFRAGLLRLGDRGAIDYRPSLTTSEVRGLLGSETFEQLASTFEHVAYGGQPAGPPDAADARSEWPRVVEQGRVRDQ
jgi:heme exporter protein D